MKAFALAVLALLSLSASARADWSIDKMNEQIDATNVNVGGVCTGTFIDVSERLVLTAHHCINDQIREKVIEEVDEKTGEIRKKTIQERVPLTIFVRKIVDYQVVAKTEHLVKIVGANKEADVAILQVVDKEFVPPAAAPLASDSYKYMRGQKIWMVGNPFGEYDASVVDGIISASQREVDVPSLGKIKMFQYSANTVGGNSGGPIYNNDGQIIGTVTGGYRGSAVQFAPPVSFTKEMLRKAGFSKVLERK
jgi:S1-C subfamily serine protease